MTASSPRIGATAALLWLSSCMPLHPVTPADVKPGARLEVVFQPPSALVVDSPSIAAARQDTVARITGELVRVDGETYIFKLISARDASNNPLGITGSLVRVTAGSDVVVRPVRSEGARSAGRIAAMVGVTYLLVGLVVGLIVASSF